MIGDDHVKALVITGLFQDRAVDIVWFDEQKIAGSQSVVVILDDVVCLALDEVNQFVMLMRMRSMIFRAIKGFFVCENDWLAVGINVQLLFKAKAIRAVFVFAVDKFSIHFDVTCG